MTRKFLPSDIADERLEGRPGRFSLFDGRLLDAGGFLIDSELFKELKTFDEIAGQGNAIIVAEGGMGKTHVLRTFCDSLKDEVSYSLLDLVKFKGCAPALEEAIKSASQERDYLFLDGLDEEPKLAAPLSRMLEKVDGRAHVIVTSRGIPQLNALSESLKWPMFSLLPYSRINVQELCEESDIDGEAFLRKIDRENLGGICSKPLSCMMLITEYRKTELKNSTSEQLWCSSVRQLCAENPKSDASDFNAEENEVTVDAAIKVATVAALALKLTGRSSVSRIGSKLPANDVLDCSKLFVEQSDKSAFNALLVRPMFRNASPGVYRFSHSSFADFLAAQGLFMYLDEKEWEKIVFAPEGEPYPQWECVVPWLAARSDSILEKTKRTRPDLLLGTDALVDRLGVGEICKAILEHADDMPSTIRDSPAVQSRYYALNTDDCAKVIRKTLKTSTSETVVDTAIDMIRRARLVSVADMLVDIFCDESRRLSLRKSAGYALIELANKRQRLKCKSVLTGPMVQDLKGIVARMTWPDSLSVDELIPLLQAQKGEDFDSFSMWIENGGFVPALARLSSRDNRKLLAWAVSSVEQGDDPLDCLADARRSVFLHCWKEERSRDILPLLAKGIVAYDAIYRSPFGNENDQWRDSCHILSWQEFRDDIERRRAVARFIVENPALPVDAVYGCWIRLLDERDGDFVLDSLEKETDSVIGKRWAECLSRIGYMKLPAKNTLWNKLHKEFPSVFACDAKTALADAKKFEEKMEAFRLDSKRKRESREANNETILVRNVAWLRRALKNGTVKGRFVSAMGVLQQQRKNSEAKSFLDFRANAIWPTLSDAERRLLAESAYDFLLKCKGPWSNENAGYSIYATAACLLFCHGRELLDDMPVARWKKVALELFWYLGCDHFELLSQTIEHFKTEHPILCFNILLTRLKNQLHAGRFGNIERISEFLNGNEISKLLGKLDDDRLSDGLRFSLYDSFVEADSETTARYVNRKYRSTPLREIGMRTVGSVLRSDPARFPELMDRLNSDPEWGVQWSKTVLSEEEHGHATIIRVLPHLSIVLLRDFYSWLRVHFPLEKVPRHGICWTPDATDHLYDFISIVFNELMSRTEDEAVSAIEELQRRFPKYAWFHDAALRLRNQLLSTRCPVVDLDAVKKLLESKKRMLIVHSAEDLLQIVLDSLSRYQTYLTGVVNPQVRFLWNEHERELSHRSEEDFSDHIKAFFANDFRHIVCNREVQLNRGRKGWTGSRTDILVDAIGCDSDKPLCLCVEVKGSWNPEVKTSYEAQLAEKYMDDGGPDAGIFLVGWFESDKERKKSRIASKTSISKLLQSQGDRLRQRGYKVEHVIIDCSI